MSAERIIVWDGQEPDPKLVEQVVQILTDESLVVAPTETRYGLLARSDSVTALQKLYEAKGRPGLMPTALFVRDAETMESHAHVNEPARKLIAAFLPGPLTLVLRSRIDWAPPRVLEGKIGFRWSSSKLIDALVKRLPFQVTATSANFSGQPESETVQQVAEQLGQSVDLYIDGGRLTGSISTVVDCSSEQPTILRVGAISPQAVFECIQD